MLISYACSLYAYLLLKFYFMNNFVYLILLSVYSKMNPFTTLSSLKFILKIHLKYLTNTI